MYLCNVQLCQKFNLLFIFYLSCLLSREKTTNEKYVELAKLILAICTVSHGNVDLERGFSTNKYLLAVHGGSASEKTIQAVCSVKDFINLNNGEKNIKVSKPMSTEYLLS